MGKNKLENFIFSITVCLLMVTGMTLYNALLLDAAETAVSIDQAIIQFLLIFCIAFIIDWFIVAPLVKHIVAKLTNAHTPFLKKVILISGLMVLFMCTAMSLVAILLHGYQGIFWLAYVKTFALNLVFALPLQFFIVGPVARAAFFKMFPVPLATSK